MDGNGRKEVLTMDAERSRKHTRYPVSIDVLVDAEGTPLTAHVTDISVTGLGMQSLKNIAPGTRANIAVQLPEDAVLYGTLIWSQHTLLNNLDAYNMGFEVDAIMYEGSLLGEIPEKDKAVQEILEKIEALKEE